MARPESVPEFFGTIAMISTSTPIPPNQCVKLLQKSIPLLMLSTSVKIDAPVVVNPLTVSKNASNTLGISPLITNGTHPTAESMIHANVTMIKPSFA